MRTIINTLLITVGAALVVGSGYIAWASYQSAAAMQREILVYRSAGLLKYGIVESVDANNRTLTVQLERPYPNSATASTSLIKITIKVPEHTYIARQDLTSLGDQAKVDSLSAQIPEPLSAILPGDHVVLQVAAGSNGALQTSFVLFGNPL